MKRKSLNSADLRVLHISAGRYNAYDTSHHTFRIWENLATDFSSYTVIARSTKPKYQHFKVRNINIHLLPSVTHREVEFYFTQYLGRSIALMASPHVVIAQCPVLGGMLATSLKKSKELNILMEFHMANYFESLRAHPKSQFLREIARRTIRSASLIRVLSEGMRESFLHTFGDQYMNRLVVLPPRVDLEIFSKHKESWTIGKKPRFVMVGRICRRKRQLELLKVLSRLERPYEVWLFGDGPELETCRSYADQNMPNKVKFFGNVTHEVLANMLPEADVLIMLSKMEGTPRAIMEGMAAGLPVLTTDAGFSSDIVQNDIHGYVLNANYESDLIEKLNIILSDPVLRERMGRTSIKTVQRKYESTRLFGEYKKLISKTAFL